jgi:hypothetical protein
MVDEFDLIESCTVWRSVARSCWPARRQTIGAVNLFRSQTGRMAEPGLSLGRGMADIAAIALLQERAVRESRGLIAGLRQLAENV